MTALNPMLSVGDQIAEVIRLHEKISRADAMRKACAMMEVVGIEGGRSGEYPHPVSYTHLDVYKRQCNAPSWPGQPS